MTILVGGVAQLYQGDLDLGRRAVERLATDDLGPEVVVEDLYYGAIAVAQRLQDLGPDALILVGAEARGRDPGSVHRIRLHPDPPGRAEATRAVGDAVTGYVTIDLVVEVGAALGALPHRTFAIEVEPRSTEPAEDLTPEGVAALDTAVDLVRAEARRIPLFEVTDRIAAALSEQRIERTPALDAIEELVAEVRSLEESGRWGRTFARRDRLRAQIAAGATGEGMTHLDWALWWGLIEALDAIQREEATP